MMLFKRGVKGEVSGCYFVCLFEFVAVSTMCYSFFLLFELQFIRPMDDDVLLCDCCECETYSFLLLLECITVC